MPISHICEGKGPKIQVLSTQAHACDGYLPYLTLRAAGQNALL